MKAITVLSVAALTCGPLAMPALASSAAATPQETANLDNLRLGSLTMMTQAQPGETFILADSMRMSSRGGGGGGNPILPAVASLVIPGLGQTLNNDSPKNLLHFLIAAGLWGGGYAATALNQPTIGYVGFGLAGVWHILSAVDAYSTAAK
jgi:hypothetical protein